MVSEAAMVAPRYVRHTHNRSRDTSFGGHAAAVVPAGICRKGRRVMDESRGGVIGSPASVAPESGRGSTFIRQVGSGTSGSPPPLAHEQPQRQWSARATFAAQPSQQQGSDEQQDSLTEPESTCRVASQPAGVNECSRNNIAIIRRMAMRR